MTVERNNQIATACSTFLEGEQIADGIRMRAKALRKTMKSVCAEAGVSYRTYISWKSYNRNPSFASLKKINAVLNQYELEEAAMK